MHIEIIRAEETLFFSHADHTLRQWIDLTIDNRLDQPAQAQVTIRAGGEEVLNRIEIAPGSNTYRAFAPVLWPNRPPEPDARLTIIAGDETAEARVSVGSHRPWTVYLLSDACVDTIWAYESEAVMRRDDARLVEAELSAAEATVDSPEPERSHYNLVHTREAEFFLEHYPGQIARLREGLRRGTLSLNPILNMCLTGDMSLEELIRQLYPARRLAKELGPGQNGEKLYRFANLQETPTAAWAMASVLAGSGIDHLVRSILPYECPWAKRLKEPPVYLWEGPDGQRVLVRLRNGDYVEGNFVLKGLQASEHALLEEILPAYERLGEAYPFDAAGLVGCYGDLAPNTHELPAKKAVTVAAFSAQGWEYPKLVNASHRQFWDNLEAQIAMRQISLPVYRGDYGASWDAWPACLAVSFAAWRQAQERAGTADKLAAVLSRLDRAWTGAARPLLQAGWQNLLALADHAWNGATPGNRLENARLRREWRRAANASFDQVIESGLAALANHISTNEFSENSVAGEEKVGLLVYNGLGWERSALVRFSLPEPGAFALEKDLTTLIDHSTGLALPAQVVDEESGKALYFVAPQVPSIGYRALHPGRGSVAQAGPKPALKIEGSRLEGPYYTLEIDSETGGIARLYDRLRGKELADPGSPYTLNEAVSLTAGDTPPAPPGAYPLFHGVDLAGMQERRSRLVRVEPGSCGPVFAELHVHSAIQAIQIHSTIRLYAELDRVDLFNVIEKPVSTEKQELDFAFPFRLPGCQARIETPGAILIPGSGQLPGAGQAWTAVRHFVDLFNDQAGITLSMADTGLVEFGHRTTGEDPQAPHLSNSTLLVPALENCIDWNESIHDQDGETRFVFRFSLRGHAGGFHPAAALRFGWEENNELRAIPLLTGQTGHLYSRKASFLSVEPENVILFTLKTAEEDGLIARLWECAGQETLARLRISGLGTLSAASQTDLLEEDLRGLEVVGNQVAVRVPPRGYTTVRLKLG